MNPTRRNLFKLGALATVIVALSAIPTTAPQPGLASVIDPTGPGLDLAALNVQLWKHWRVWPAGRRLHFLTMIDREFPDLSAATVTLIERRNARLGGRAA